VGRERPRLDRTAVLVAANAVIDAEGLDALTIRRLAGVLEVTPMALYWHFADKQALIDALVDEMWTDAWIAISTREDELAGLDRLRASLHAMIDVFRRHPSLAMLAPMRVTACEPGLAITESGLEILESLGLGVADAAETARFMLSSAIMLVTSQPGVIFPDATVREEMARTKRAAMMTLSPERYPRIIEAAEYLIDCDSPGAYYDSGVELIIGGIAARVAAV
jgi:AcrR family transcriptional regulator